jgi:hypothetical protein
VKNLVKDLGVTAGGRFGFVVKPPSCLCEGGVGGFGFCGIASSDDALTCTSSGSIVPGVAAIVARLASYEDSIDRVSLSHRPGQERARLLIGVGIHDEEERCTLVLISKARWTGRDRDPWNAVSC